MNDDRELVFARIREALAAAPREPRANRDPHAGGYRTVLPGVADGADATERGSAWVAAFARRSEQLRTEFVCCDAGAFAATVRGLAALHDWRRPAFHAGLWTARAIEALDLPAFELLPGYDARDLEACDLGITACDALVAESGSVLLTSRRCGGRALSILPPHHLVVATEAQLVPDLSAAMEIVGGRHGLAVSSLVTLHTGPSRTGDIERTIVLGAHGPKRLTVVMVGDGDALPLARKFRERR